MSKEKAIELIREVKHSLFLIKSMLYIRDEDTLVEKMDLNIQNVIRYLKSWRIDYDKARSGKEYRKMAGNHQTFYR